VRSITFTIPGPPIAWKRPIQVGNRRVAGQRNLRRAIGTFAAIAMRGKEPLTGAVAIDAIAAMPITGDHQHGAWHISRPDVDNLIKIVLDSVLAIIYEDDAQVASLHIDKRYDADPRFEITVTELR
jgi:Holliday junction resolvase RusA-like endonuclease